jgi:hypothetical protein
MLSYVHGFMTAWNNEFQASSLPMDLQLCTTCILPQDIYLSTSPTYLPYTDPFAS